MMERNEVQAVIIAKLDRMTRNIRDLTDLVDLANRKGIALISVNEHIDTGSAAGRMILNMLGVLAQWERETIGERTATALQFKKINGKAYNCNALYGFKNKDGSLLPVESEQETITLILHLREQNFSYKAISDRLNELGIKSRSGNHWRSEQIRRIILHSTDRNEIQKSIIPNVPV
jgi:DNA invertase Pin-like site-specific DNA recombinase